MLSVSSIHEGPLFSRGKLFTEPGQCSSELLVNEARGIVGSRASQTASFINPPLAKKLEVCLQAALSSQPKA